MTSEEAFVKVLQRHGIDRAFGIIGSAFMPISDLFPKAGTTFWDVAHETNGGIMCDGYTRATARIAMAIAQNGPGVTNFVTAVKTAYWNHTPMLVVTPRRRTRRSASAASRAGSRCRPAHPGARRARRRREWRQPEQRQRPR
jgi:sulfoacetaldehyde acetyltransferase